MLHHRIASVSLRATMAGVLALLAGHASAGGFSLSEMSAASVGNAHAGGAAVAEDASTIYYNPAGMTRLPGMQFSIAGSAIRPSAKFSNNGSLSAVGSPLTGGNGGDAGDWAGVPAAYFSAALSNNLSVGIGVQAPFGLRTEYDQGWVGRYQALTSDLKSVNVSPAIAWKVNDMVSLGGGINAQYVDVELSRAIDFGSVCVGSVGLAPCAAAGYLPQTRDGVATVQGNDWGYGYNLGVLLTPSASTRFGVTYHSKIKQDVDGDITFDLPAGLPAPLAAVPSFRNAGASASIDLPESVSLSGYADLDPKWSVMGDVTWMRWSRFKELRINFDNGASASVTPEQWRDTTRVSAAVNYRYSDAMKVRAGVAWDPSPVKDEFRTPRIPDADRTWLSVGAQFKPSRNSAIDVGYAHLFVKDSTINKAEPPVGGTLVGNYENNVNIVSVQYSYAF